MKVVKITALWCPACLIMNKRWEQINPNIETTNLDYDFDEDEVKKYDVGKTLPVFIFFKNNQEIKRIIGEHSKEELESIIKEVK